MDDLKPIVYIFFIVIYVISRIMKGAKKLKQEQSQQKPVGQIPPPVKMPPTPVFKEMKKPVQKPKIEIKQKVFAPERKAKKADTEKRRVMPGSIETTEPVTTPIERIGMETGFSSLPAQIKQTLSREEQKQSAAFEFDPRQAFMLKTLLERHPLV